MDPKEALRTLESDFTFQQWKENHPDDILAHVFLEPDNIQIGYYDSEKSTMTTFVLGAEVRMIPDQEILRGDGQITPVDIEHVHITPKQAQDTADAVCRTHYSAEGSIKSLCILQNIEDTLLYNITYFTASFKAINIKVSALDGTIVRHSIGSLVDIEKGKRTTQ